MHIEHFQHKGQSWARKHLLYIRTFEIEKKKLSPLKGIEDSENPASASGVCFICITCDSSLTLSPSPTLYQLVRLISQRVKRGDSSAVMLSLFRDTARDFGEERGVIAFVVNFF